MVNVSGRNTERYFWGTKEILMPRYRSYDEIPIPPKAGRDDITMFLNMNSGRRAAFSSREALRVLPSLKVGVIFAENMPEKLALDLYGEATKQGKIIIGPASVGLIIPNKFKLGPIGGLPPAHQGQSGLFTEGNVAVFSASGGMVGEIITVLAQAGKHLSFALHFGGDRFPILTPKEAFLAAEKDNKTEHIAYYGELGGVDEYEVAELIKNKEITKPVYAYIAGAISEMFETPPQFGHAKAMAKKGEETAQAKRKALQDVGVHVASTFEEFVQLLQNIPTHRSVEDDSTRLQITIHTMEERKKKLFMSSISADKDGMPSIIGENILSAAKNHSFGYIVTSLLLGRRVKSKELPELVEFIMKLLVDHGPYQSGVVNTMVTARAGRDLVSSLASGLLTIGPRFGGATNEAAGNWLRGVRENINPHDFVEQFVSEGTLIQGIGHRKYRADFPDPRVKPLEAFAKDLKEKKYLQFAREVEKITTGKKGNLILNVDGAMAAVLLDMLAEKEGLSEKELQALVDAEFFNAPFVLSRSVGFVAHYLDQKRLDEGLFRLSPEDVAEVEI